MSSVELTWEEQEKLSQEFEQRCEERKQLLTHELQTSGKYLDVCAKKLDDLDALTIAFHLHDCKTQIKLFHIGGNNFSDQGLIDMLSGLQWHLKIEEIYIGNNEFSDLGLEAFAEVLDSFEQLRILSMGNCGIQDDSFIQLCYQLSSLKKLQQLFVPSNNIGDYGLICLSSLLTTESLPSLRVLHLGQNPLTSQSLNSFFLALQKNSKLRVLYLNDISLKIVTVYAIADYLKKKSSLEELNLGNTGFSDQAAQIIWPVLPYTQLTTLQLWSNHLTDVSVLSLLDIVEEHQNLKLEHIGLSENEIIDDELVKELNEILKQNLYIERVAITLKSKQRNQLLTAEQSRQQDIQLEKSEKPKSDNTESSDQSSQQSSSSDDDEQKEDEQLDLLDQGLKETNDLEKSVLIQEKNIRNHQNQDQDQDQIIKQQKNLDQIHYKNDDLNDSGSASNSDEKYEDENKNAFDDNPLQGQLKTYFWKGEHADPSNLIHSKLELI